MLPVVVNVANTGTVAGDEIVMVFVSFPEHARRGARIKELKGFARVTSTAGEEKQVTIPVRLSDLDYFQMDAPTGDDGQVGGRERDRSRSWSAAAPRTFR